MLISSSSTVLWSSAYLATFITPAFHYKTSKLFALVLLPQVSQANPRPRSKQGAILPQEYFTLGRSTADKLMGRFMSHKVGHFLCVHNSQYMRW
jgi:hypothetical protein